MVFRTALKTNHIDGYPGQWVQMDMTLALEFNRVVEPSKIDLRFDSNLSKGILISLFPNRVGKQVPGIPPELVKDYTIECFQAGRLVHRKEVKGNYLSHRRHNLLSKISRDTIKIRIQSTNGNRRACLSEIRLY